MKTNCHIREYRIHSYFDGTDFTLPGSTADRYIYAYSYDSFGRLTESARYAGFSVNPNNIFTEKNLTYDRNGNMTLDALRNISLTYDINNLVSTVSRNDTLLATYHYLADGTKYKVVDRENKGRAYIGPFSYALEKIGNTVYSYLEGIDTDGGRIMVLKKQNGNQTTADYTTAFFVKDHLGSTRVMLNAQGDILERNAYYPFGLQMNQGKAYPTLTERLPQLYSGYASSTPARRDLYNGKELQTAAGTDYLDYGFRQYDQTIARWFNIDPKAEKYLTLTPYSYCAGNPINIVDIDGAANSPIYDTNGYFLGTDDHGLQGKAIVLDKKDYEHGMSHEEALSKNKGVKGLASKEAEQKLVEHYHNLHNRPDYDGYITALEGIKWALQHPGALLNPTPDNRLYADASKLDFGNLSTRDFSQVGKEEPIQLRPKILSWNMVNSLLNNNQRNTIYALGEVYMILLSSQTKEIKIVNGFSTDFDWNYSDNYERYLLISSQRCLFNLNDTHGFQVIYYGKGKLKE